jgi:dephospho-CoA kinase
MRRIALTGGIATGKSHCLQRFVDRGASTIDADRLAKDAVRQGTPGWAAVCERFGPSVLRHDGEIDRARLGALVFADEDARRDLEAIIHPKVYDAIAGWFRQLELAGRAFGIADIPLLFETGHESAFDLVIVAACPRDAQIARLLARGLSDAEARQRLEAQWPIEEKSRRADIVIETGGTFEDTDRQVDRVYEELSRT